MKYQTAITLIELLVSISILSLLSLAAVPNFAHFVHDAQANSYIAQLNQNLNDAKHQARRLNSRVTICVTNEQGQCIKTKDWSQGFIIFVDRAKSGKLENPSDILKRHSGPGNQAKLLWSGFHDYLTISADGSLAYQQGSFNYMAKVKRRYDRKLVISPSGRIRIDEAG